MMLWLIVCALSLANGSKCERSGPLMVSISDMVRMGTTLMSRFFSSKSPRVLSSLSNKLTKEIKMSQREGEDERNELILLMMSLTDGDNKKITNFAFDGLISLVLLMIQVFLKNSENRRKERMNFSLFRFILSQPQVGHLLTLIQDPELVDLVLEKTEENIKYYPEKNVDCIRSLICRMKPFVQKMQRSLSFFMSLESIRISGQGTCEESEQEATWHRPEDDNLWAKANTQDRMYFFVPSLREVLEFGDKCNQLFPNCVY